MSNNWLIWSNDHGMWWRANSDGYTQIIAEAGRYPEQEAKRIACDSNRNQLGGETPSEVAICISDMYAGENKVLDCQHSSAIRQHLGDGTPIDYCPECGTNVIVRHLFTHNEE